MQRLSLGRRLAYGAGDIGTQLTWSVASSFLVLFYTEVVGLTAGVAALVMLLARTADLAIDPLVGSVVERTRSRWGRFRPWLLWAPPALVLAGLLAFGVPPLGPDAASRVVLAGLTYVVMGTALAFVVLPYNALPAVMTAHPLDRVALNSWRMVGTNLGGLFLGGLAMPLILFFGGGTLTGRGFLATVAVLGIVAIPVYWLVFATAREVVPVTPARKVGLRAMVAAITDNRQLMVLFASNVLMLTGLGGRMSVIVFYYLYTLGRPDLVSYLMMTQSLAGAVGILALSRVAARLDKRVAVMVSFAAAAALQVALFLTPPDQVGLVFVLTALIGICMFGAPIAVSMTADTVDWFEDRTGRRNDGIAFSTMSLGPKFAGAVGGALALAIMGLFGYQSGAAMTPTAATGISVATNLVPALLQLAALVPLRWYTISNAEYAALRARLDARHAAARGPAGAQDSPSPARNS